MHKVLVTDEEIENVSSRGRMTLEDIARGAKNSIVWGMGMLKLKEAGAPIDDSTLVPRATSGAVQSFRSDMDQGYIFVWRPDHAAAN